MNRAARFANSAAHGGQICAPAAVGQALILALTKQTLSLEGEQPLLLVQPDFVPQKMQLRPSVPWMSQGAAHPLRPKRALRRTAFFRGCESPTPSPACHEACSPWTGCA